MDAKTFFFERYRGLQEYPERLLEDLPEVAIRAAPAPGVNSIAWLLWHIARAEDVAVNCLFANRDQVFDLGWARRLGLHDMSIGTGMTEREVVALSKRINLKALMDYRSIVLSRTADAVERTASSVWLERLSLQLLDRVFAEDGAGGRASQWLTEAYFGQTKGWLLGHLGLTHSFYHLGQAFAARRLLGVPSSWDIDPKGASDTGT